MTFHYPDAVEAYWPLRTDPNTPLPPPRRLAEGFGPHVPIDPVVRAAFEADRHGQDLNPAIRRLAEGSRFNPYEGLVRFCEIAYAHIPAEAGPNWRAWREGSRPSTKLGDAVLQAFEAKLRAALAGSEEERRAAGLGDYFLPACQAARGDLAGLERGIALRGPPTDAVHLTLLTSQPRWLDETIGLAETARPGRTIDWPDDPGLRRDKGIFPEWSDIQQARTRLLLNAQVAGRRDLADRVAEVVLNAVSAPDRPPTPVGDSGAPAAFAWLIQSGQKQRAAAWVERLKPIIQPGQRGWNYQDTLALHRTLLSLGQVERARAYADAVMDGVLQLPPRDDEHLRETYLMTGYSDGVACPLETVLAMYGADGRWDLVEQARGREDEGDHWYRSAAYSAVFRMFEAATAHGDGEGLLETAFAKAPDSLQKGRVLGLCAEALPLDVAAACVRRAVALDASHRSDLEGNQQAWPLQGVIQIALSVGGRAARSDRLDLAQEMLSLAMAQWAVPGSNYHAGGLVDPYLTDMLDILTADLHDRGKF